jgi:DNA invertase Pin-like site-specific DNA recombinase
MVRAGVYIRVSKAKREVLDAQRQQPPCEAFCAQQGWQVVGIYLDDSTSAYTGVPRENFEGMLADVRAGRLDAIVSWQADRLLRTVEDAGAIVAIAKETGVQVANVGGSIDLSTAEGRRRFYEAAVAAQYESELKSERLRLKHAEIAAAGGWQGGQRPFGYDLVPYQDGNRIKYQLAPNPGEAAAIYQAAKEILGGGSLSAIETRWAQGTIRRPRGGIFHYWQIKALLTNPRIAGLRQVDSTLVPAVWEAIVSREEHEDLVAILGPARSHGGGTGGLPSARTYLLGGFLHCGRCGTRLRAKKGDADKQRDKPAQPKYVCDRRDGGCGGIKRLAEPVERYVVQQVVRDAPRRLLKATRTPSEAWESLAGLTRRRETEEARLRGLSDYLADGTLSKHEYLRQKQRVQGRLDKLEAEITKLRAQAPRRRLLGATFQEVEAAWDRMGLEERRLVLAECISHVTIRPAGHGKRFQPDQVEIVWREESS